MQGRENVPPAWWGHAIALKDDLTLREISDRLGVPISTLTAAFRRHGVKRVARGARSGTTVSSTSHEDGGALRPDRRSGSKDVQIEQYFHLLGRVPDSEVSRLAGVSVRTVASYRSRNAIDGYEGPRRRPAPRGRRESKVNDFEELLGVVPDRVVAQEAGMSLGAVRNYRIKQNISPAGRLPASEIARIMERYRAGRQDPSAARSAKPVVPRTPPVVAEGMRAWRVEREDDGEAFVVLAGSLAEAAGRAGSVLKDEHLVRSIEHLGIVLNPADCQG